MNDISSLKDYYLADCITRIEAMPHDEVVRRLIALETEKIENMTDDEILRFNQIEHDATNSTKN